jgi:hypothetical protein
MVQRSESLRGPSNRKCPHKTRRSAFSREDPTKVTSLYHYHHEDDCALSRQVIRQASKYLSLRLQLSQTIQSSAAILWPHTKNEAEQQVGLSTKSSHLVRISIFLCFYFKNLTWVWIVCQSCRASHVGIDDGVYGRRAWIIVVRRDVDT